MVLRLNQKMVSGCCFSSPIRLILGLPKPCRCTYPLPEGLSCTFFLRSSAPPHPAVHLILSLHLNLTCLPYPHAPSFPLSQPSPSPTSRVQSFPPAQSSLSLTFHAQSFYVLPPIPSCLAPACPRPASRPYLAF